LTLIGTDVDTDDEDGKIQFDVNWGVNDIDLKCDQKIIDALK
jgi:hypothetical protein